MTLDPISSNYQRVWRWATLWQEVGVWQLPDTWLDQERTVGSMQGLSPSSSDIPEALKSPSTVPLAADQVFRLMSLWGPLHIHTTDNKQMSLYPPSSVVYWVNDAHPQSLGKSSKTMSTLSFGSKHTISANLSDAGEACVPSATLFHSIGSVS